MVSSNATSSICPKGWKLPTGGSGGEFEAMAKKYGNGIDQATSTALLTTPIPGFVLYGYHNDEDGNTGMGSDGEYWSSTAYSTRIAHSLTVYPTGLDPTNHVEEHVGRSVRCVSK